MIGRLMGLAVLLGLAGNTARAETVEVDGGQIYYESCGSGPKAIVLIHDGVVNAASFDDIWPILCKDFRVVRYDRRGYGRSPAAKAAYSPQEDLAAVMRAAALGRASLAGFSFGGGLAVSYAIQHPEQVDRLILSGAALNGFKTSKAFTARITRVMMPMVIGNMDAVIANASKETWIMAPGNEPARAKLAALIKANPGDLRHQLKDPIRSWPSDLPRMGEIKAPTLILVGDHDIADNQAQAGAAQVLIPGARRVVVEGAGHLMQLERPKEVAELIADFVRKDP
ncbi:MAG: alpha/beta fold hydrolase [Phenylobacterium sp.]